MGCILRQALSRWLIVVVLGMTSVSGQSPRPLPGAAWTNLPAWRGFNLLNKFHRDWSNRPFEETEFRQMSGLGFNFVRIPIDYRTYVSGGDWTRFSEPALAELDRAVDFGRLHGIHVCLALHRIPGYTVASPSEARDLFTDVEAQRVAALHWRTLAMRYVGIPNSQVSFNLFNEPPDVSVTSYSNVVARLCAAIREVDPGRLIIADGLDYGRVPVPGLIPLGVAQSTRGYSPFGLTHYQADWVAGASGWSLPEWPSPAVANFLYGPQKPNLRTALRLQTQLLGETRMRVRVGQVSARSRLTIRANGVLVFDKLFVPGPGTGEWSKVVYEPNWKIYQNIYDRDYDTILPAGTTSVTVDNVDGDWMTFLEIGLRRGDGGIESVLRPGLTDWGVRQTSVVTYRQVDQARPFTYTQAQDREWLWRETIQPWLALRDRGVGILVGEWGCHNRTPHAVTLAWMRDCLINYQRAGLGWALWNFGGNFGPLDSGRTDVSYEPWDGRGVDRRMLDLLVEFTGQRESYAQWRDRVLPPGSDRDPDSDWNSDGLVNGFCYATGTDPKGRTSPAPLDVRIGLGGAEIRYRTSLREIGTEFRLEQSSDLLSWREIVAEPPKLLETGSGVALWGVRVPDDEAGMFVRLRVDLNP